VNRFTSHADLKPGPASVNWPACQFFPVYVKQITAPHAGPSENAASRRVQAMKKPAKRIPRWLTIDLLILVVGAIITVASALWLGSNLQRMVLPPG
jgi:hypothetical protein